jgi:hypothetical protein
MTPRQYAFAMMQQESQERTKSPGLSNDAAAMRSAFLQYGDCIKGCWGVIDSKKCTCGYVQLWTAVKNNA